MPFIEAPTTFYLGRRFDPTTHRTTDEVVYYDSRDLTTHAVVLGMTGSGKTGLCITLLEEAVMDSIPSIIIDPKGDITNLLLTFPDLKPEEFEPWVNIDDARRAGVDAPEYARQIAQQWRDGLAEWDITPERMRTFKDNARFTIYTPGSDAGLPISILDAMQAPPGGWAPGDDEFHRERISGIVTALLALVGRNVEPIRDREHVLIANIFEYAWRQGQDLTLESVILQVQKPPFSRLGVFDVDTMFPEKDRFSLAMELNNIIASPSFQSWIQGESLDVQSLLYTPEGKPRVSIFYIAHLSDAERMFIVTLLLENMLSWMRSLSGTTSLRALLYFDEVFGFFPSHPYNPPSKEPLLRLLKQARAFGLGLIVATQNPADIDYKGLANAGTWFIGKLQTENDKNKLLSGLESVVTADGALKIDTLDRLLGSIDPRVFVMHNVHDRVGPIAMHTRWAMSFLRGPLTRQQLRILMADQREHPYYPASDQAQPVTVTSPGVPSGTSQVSRASRPMPPASLPEMPPSLPGLPPPEAQSAPPASLPGLSTPPPDLPGLPGRPPQSPPPIEVTQPTGTVVTQPFTPVTPAAPVTPVMNNVQSTGVILPPGVNATPPPLPSSVAQYYVRAALSADQAIRNLEQSSRVRAAVTGDARLAYIPALLAQADVRYADRKSGVSLIQSYTYEVPDADRVELLQWDDYRVPYINPRDLDTAPYSGAAYGDLPSGLSDAKRITALRGEMVDFLYKAAVVTVAHNPELDLYADPQMQQRDFLVQAQNLARQKRDEEVDKITARYGTIFDRLEGQLRKQQRDLASEQQQVDALRNEEMWTMGEAALSLLRGRTTYTLSRVSRTRRYKSQASDNVYEAGQRINEIAAQLDETQQTMEDDLRRINDKWAQIANHTEDYRITPYKKDIQISFFGLGWIPYWLVTLNNQPTLLPGLSE